MSKIPQNLKIHRPQFNTANDRIVSSCRNLHTQQEQSQKLSPQIPLIKMDHHEQVVPLHVLIFPLPIQSPVNSMLKLAELLSLAGLRVTFLNTHHIHHRLLKHADVQSRFARYPEFRFETISDGLPEDHKRSGDLMIDILEGIEGVMKPHFKEMLTSGRLSSKSGTPITCIIADGFFHFAVDIAKEVGIPLFYFETLSPCAVWVHFCLPKLFEVGEIPFKGNDLDAKVTSVPGMENFLRRRDLPIFCRNNDLNNDPIMQHVLKEDQELPRAQGVILNTFEDLEEPILTHIRTICPNLYPIGPIHALHKSIVSANKSPVPQVNSSNSIWEEDKSCMTWLDAQPPKSVIYVSIGSLAVMTRDQLMELWHGLVNSGKRFLWVRRQGSVREDDQKNETPAELTDATKERGCIVSWVQQEEVLVHPSIGVFLTHSGWNSTLESIVEGLPMICWPYFVDQQVNSTFVGEVWRIGVDMKDCCYRGIIEKMIRDVMEVRKDEFEESANVWAKLARQSVCEGGSSYHSLARLIKDLRKMSLSTPQA